MTQKYQVKVSMKQAAIVETGIVLKQGDFGMQIEIEVLDFDATGTTPQIVFRKAMGAVESTTITVSSNKYTYTFKGTELDTPGKVFCDLKLKNSTTQRISTASFMFRVVADTLDGLAEESSSYSDTIAQIVAGFDGDIQEVKDSVSLSRELITAYENKPNGSFDFLFDGVISGSNKWLLSDGIKHTVIPITPGDSIYIKAQDGNPAIYAVLSDYIPAVNNESPIFSSVSGFTERTVINQGNETSFTTPSDGNFLYITCNGPQDIIPAQLTINGNNAKLGIAYGIKNLLNSASALIESGVTYDLNSLGKGIYSTFGDKSYTNFPTNPPFAGILEVYEDSRGNAWQRLTKNTGTIIYTRVKLNNTWTNWSDTNNTAVANAIEKMYAPRMINVQEVTKTQMTQGAYNTSREIVSSTTSIAANRIYEVPAGTSVYFKPGTKTQKLTAIFSYRASLSSSNTITKQTEGYIEAPFDAIMSLSYSYINGTTAISPQDYDATTKVSINGTDAKLEIYDKSYKKATKDDFTFGAAAASDSAISYIFSGTRIRAISKYKLHDAKVRIKSKDDYPYLVFTASGQLFNGTGEWQSNGIIDGEFAIVLKSKDDVPQSDFDSFMSHFEFDIVIDKNDFIMPSDGVFHFSVPVNIELQGNGSGNTVQDAETIAYDNGILVLPKNYTETGEAKRLAIVCHGAGATPYENRTMDNTGKIIGDPQRMLNKMGYAVMDMYANPYAYSGGTDELHYGNPVALECYIKGYEYVIKHFNIKTDGILVSGSSMGGLTSFDIVNSSRIPVIAQAGFCPCIELFKQAYCNPWSSPAYQRSQIAKLYGFTGTEPTWTSNVYPSADEIQYFKDNQEKTNGYYPILHGGTGTNFAELSSVAPQSPTSLPSQVPEEKALYDDLSVYHKVPLKIWHCKDDSVMSYRYSVYLSEAMKRNGCLVYLRPFESGGHSAWAAGNDVTMVDIEGNEFTVKASQYECYLWFKRFEW